VAGSSGFLKTSLANNSGSMLFAHLVVVIQAASDGICLRQIMDPSISNRVVAKPIRYCLLPMPEMKNKPLFGILLANSFVNSSELGPASCI
jgi:hypothetical protein